MPHIIAEKQQLRWLLKDKYDWNESQISEFIQKFMAGEQLPVSPELSKDLIKLEEGEPIAYVIGWVDFLGCKIDLSKRTLIPRPETEYWVGEVIKEISAELSKNPSMNLRILDLCCGSGCIGISILKKFPNQNVTVEFVDIDPNAIAQTELNLDLNHIEKTKTKVLQAHLFDSCSGEYDLILSNPPYVDISGEVGEETKYEPQHALFAQNSGLSLIEEILLKAKNYLKIHGKLFLEFGMGQEDDIKKLAEKSEALTTEFRKDQFGVTRFTKLTFRHQN